MQRMTRLLRLRCEAEKRRATKVIRSKYVQRPYRADVLLSDRRQTREESLGRPQDTNFGLARSVKERRFSSRTGATHKAGETNPSGKALGYWLLWLIELSVNHLSRDEIHTTCKLGYNLRNYSAEPSACAAYADYFQATGNSESGQIDRI
jgi:hypothetical protein